MKGEKGEWVGLDVVNKRPWRGGHHIIVLLGCYGNLECEESGLLSSSYTRI